VDTARGDGRVEVEDFWNIDGGAEIDNRLDSVDHDVDCPSVQHSFAESLCECFNLCIGS
jgi:hypothetical protein